MCVHVCVRERVTHTVAAPVLPSSPLFQLRDSWPGSHHKHNEREDLAGQSGILMIHMFISYLPTSTPYSPHSLHRPSSLHPLIKRMCVWYWDSEPLCVPCQHTTYRGWWSNGSANVRKDVSNPVSAATVHPHLHLYNVLLLFNVPCFSYTLLSHIASSGRDLLHVPECPSTTPRQ